MVKLYGVTGEKKYLDLAKFFLDVRGNCTDKTGSTYDQSHKPVVEQEEAVGHSVRALYMFTGMADVAAITGDDSYNEASHRLWRDIVETKLYITGGVGAILFGVGQSPHHHFENEGRDDFRELVDSGYLLTHFCKVFIYRYIGAKMKNVLQDVCIQIVFSVEIFQGEPVGFENLFRRRAGAGGEHALFKIVIGHSVAGAAADIVEMVPEVVG